MAVRNASYWEALLQFIKEHRSNAIGFEALNKKLEEVIQHTANKDAALHHDFTQIQEKYATAYTDALAQGGTAWPEYEALVTGMERSAVAALKASGQS